MSSLTGYLNFEPTDSGSIDASANIGSFVRSGNSGALISNHNSIENSGLSFVFVDGDISSNAIAESAHGLDTGDKVRFTTSGTLPTGLSLATDYYVIRINANSFKVAASPQDAERGVVVSITADGSGNHTLTAQDMAVKALDVHVVNPLSIDIALTQADEITVFQGTSPWVVSGTVELGATSLAALETIELGATTLAALENIVVSGTVELGATTLAALETIELGATTLAALENITVSATDLDIRDLSHLAGKDSVRLGDGTSMISSTLVGSKQSLDVYLANDDLANAAIENTSTAVSTSAVNVVSAALSGRKFLALANEGNKILYFGKSGVSVANGFPLYMREKALFRIGASVAPQIIGATGASSEDLRVMELS